MSSLQRLRTLIVDDEPLAIERLQVLLSRLPDIELSGTASDGLAALRLVEALAPDLILLDISMPGLDGLAVARALGQRAASVSIIFVTAFDQFAVSAFDVAAVDYLLKPVAAERLERAIARVRAQLAEPPAHGLTSIWTTEFWVTHRSEVIRIAAASIDLIAAERDYMRLHVGARSFLIHKTITELEQQLDPKSFVRLHRSTIAPRDRIASLKHDGGGIWDAVMQDGKSLRIGRSYLPALRTMMGR
jgi:two-component system response regulator AlgR